MDMQGRFHIAAPKERVWAALNDPEVLKASLPGCESLTRISATEFEAVATQAIGPVKARFKGKVTLADLDPPNSYTLRGEGQGGVAGFARGEARVHLETEGDGTVLVYEARAVIGGKLAQVGQRLIDGAAKKIADEFFSRFSEHVAPTRPATPEPATVSGQGLPASLWIAALLAIVAAALLAVWLF